ncbi:MAG: T9SS type A sorting domain-containing protein [Fibrobacterota bacterium]
MRQAGATVDTLRDSLDLQKAFNYPDHNDDPLFQTRGRTYYIAPGEYRIGRKLVISRDSVMVLGLTGNPEDVVLRGQGFVDGNRTDDFIFQIWYASDIIISGVTMYDAMGAGVQMTDNIDRALIRNCRFIDIGERSVKIPKGGTSDSCIIDSNYFHQINSISPDREDGFDGEYVAGIDGMDCNGWIIRDNVFRGIQGANNYGRSAIFFWNGCKDLLIERNIIFDCDYGIWVGNPSSSKDIENVMIKNNFIHTLPGRSAFDANYSKNIYFYNNTCYNDCFSGGSYNTEVCSGAPVHFSAVVKNSDSVMIENNILMGTIDNRGTMDYSNNCFNAERSWFVNPDSGDLHLAEYNAEVVNAGTVLESVPFDIDGDPRTSSNDMGADQYTSEDAIEDFKTDNFVPSGIFAFPNPFNPKVSMFFPAQNPAGKTPRMRIYNLTGKLIKEVFGNPREGGFSFFWNGSTGTGEGASSGIYICRLKYGGKTESLKIILAR